MPPRMADVIPTAARYSCVHSFPVLLVDLPHHGDKEVLGTSLTSAINNDSVLIYRGSLKIEGKTSFKFVYTRY